MVLVKQKKRKRNNKKCGFLSRSLDILGASLLENMLTGKGVQAKIP